MAIQYGIPFPLAKAFVIKVLAQPQELLAAIIFADLLEDHEVQHHELFRHVLESEGEWVLRKAKYAYCKFPDQDWFGRTLWWQSTVVRHRALPFEQVLIGPIPTSFETQCVAKNITIHNIDVYAQSGNCRCYRSRSWKYIHTKYGWMCWSCHEYWRHIEHLTKTGNSFVPLGQQPEA